jgi:hypothetical protein
MKRIDNHVKQVHKITVNQYKRLYHSQVVCDRLRVLASEQMTIQWKNNRQGKIEHNRKASKKAVLITKGKKRTDPIFLRNLKNSLLATYRHGRKPAKQIGLGKQGYCFMKDGSKIWFRSTWEKRFGLLLENYDIKFGYEKCSFNLGNTTYRPDFYVYTIDSYVEIKTTWNGWLKKFLEAKGFLFSKLYPTIKLFVLTEPKSFIDFVLEVLKLGELRESPTSQQIDSALGKWNLKTLLNHNLDNLQPSSLNNIKVKEKVQRLTGEEFTNNPDMSAQHLCKEDDDIVWTTLKDVEVRDKELLR